MHNPLMAHDFTTSYLKDATELLGRYKRMGERAVAQVEDEALLTMLDGESNSIAIIVKHLAGNMQSRWKDFLTTDGEKPNRNRDREFEDPPKTRAELMVMWELGWQQVFATIGELSDDDLNRTVTIRNEPHSVMQAINRQMTHYSYHVGQIVFLAKHFSDDRWKTLSIPRGKSNEYAARIASGKAPQRS